MAAACDVVENVNLLVLLGDDGGATAPVLVTAFAAVKFVLLALAVVYLLAVLARLALAPRRGPSAVGHR